MLKLPTKEMALFVSNSDSIYALSLKTQKAVVKIDEPIFHFVRKGEYLEK